eukprot:CAMPEP_0183336474 /NCGR_PEP_ID=MMETSP0164_2-20130417/4443_1 /TAXON_ID=221442 /ORGANISM="Coccolithus pelagicus ssp braarudi, Strain PLY182g" /LENGTH=86 /DNA_ID=CAMNT_0025505999 /DNA_START=230 /DNA_END=490 /DNA_ORIENTATION=+
MAMDGDVLLPDIAQIHDPPSPPHPDTAPTTWSGFNGASGDASYFRRCEGEGEQHGGGEGCEGEDMVRMTTSAMLKCACVCTRACVF